MTTNQVQTLKYVKKTSSLSYSCKSCLVSQKCLVRHIYVYPKHSEYDYNPFYACPVEEKKRAFLLSTTTYNVKCVIKKITTAIQLVTCGCVILVEKQLRLSTTPKEYICINDKAQTDSYDSVVWLCSKCSLLNLCYFNDSSRLVQLFRCNYCNM